MATKDLPKSQGWTMESFLSPVVILMINKQFLALGLDDEAAFLHGELDEEICMCIPGLSQDTVYYSRSPYMDQ
jgi:hypothetical protein